MVFVISNVEGHLVTFSDVEKRATLKVRKYEGTLPVWVAITRPDPTSPFTYMLVTTSIPSDHDLEEIQTFTPALQDEQHPFVCCQVQR